MARGAGAGAREREGFGGRRRGRGGAGGAEEERGVRRAERGWWERCGARRGVGGGPRRGRGAAEVRGVRRAERGRWERRASRAVWQEADSCRGDAVRAAEEVGGLVIDEDVMRG